MTPREAAQLNESHSCHLQILTPANINACKLLTPANIYTCNYFHPERLFNKLRSPFDATCPLVLHLFGFFDFKVISGSILLFWMRLAEGLYILLFLGTLSMIDIAGSSLHHNAKKYERLTWGLPKESNSGMVLKVCEVLNRTFQKTRHGRCETLDSWIDRSV